MRSISCLFLMAAALIGAATSTVVRFKSKNVIIRVENGYYKADVSYKYDSDGKSYLRYDYSEPTPMIEIINYTDGTRAKICTSCESGFYPYSAPALFQQDGDIATGASEGDCYEYTPSVNYAVTSIWYKKDSANTLCKATLADGKTLVFENTIDKNFNDDTVFDITKLNCPAPICKRVMDLVFVIDNSGSVSRSDWENAKKFIISVANSFDIATDATMIGVIAYGKAARTIIGLEGNKDSIINAVNSAAYQGGTTCTGCGMDLAMKFFNSTSAARNSLNPEKVMMVVTDGENNELDYYQFCRKYKSTCTKRGTTCKMYNCTGTSHKVNGPVCLRYENTTTCLKKACSDCKTKGKCLVYDTTNCVNRSTTNCVKRSTTFCNGNPSSYCCSYNKNKGTLSNYGGCGKCECTDYRCDEWGCDEYECLVYDCNDCVTYSEDCLIYKQNCLEYQQIDMCDVAEVCTEYECLQATVTCAEYGKGANSLLAGAISRTRTEWALTPASTRLPIVFAIGVSGANKYELMGIASTLEGKQLVYEVKDYSKLATIITDLVDETCTKQTENLEACSDDCHGFCGCNKQCFCPKCDQANGNCYSIDCRTDGKTSTGCVATHETCPNDNKCIVKTPNNSTDGCCDTTDVDCVKSADKCKIYGCDPATGCTEKDVKCTPSSACFSVKCDPAKGCVETPVCDDSDPCKVMSCAVVNNKPVCSYTPKCTSNDPCKLPVCTNGVCSLKDKVCTPSNGCLKSTCFRGDCIEEEDVDKKIACAALVTDSCSEGYCDEADGECKIKSIPDAGANCANCGRNTSLNCAAKSNECVVYTCVADNDYETTTDFFPTKCVEEDICVNTSDPCQVRECVDGKCVRRDPCGEPTSACETVTCIADSTITEGYRCERSRSYQADDECWTYMCNETTGKVTNVSKCLETKCKEFVKCTIVEGEGKCEYKDKVVCTSNACTESYCDETTGECVYMDNSTNCNLHEPCMVYTCRNNSGCYPQPVVCDDNDPCTIDTCVPITDTSSSNTSYTREDIERGYVCVFTAKCPKRSYCESATCNSMGNCSYSDYACDGENETKPEDSCHTLKCSDEEERCLSVLLPSAFLDVCGECVKEYGKNASLDEDYEAKKCIAGMSMPSFAATIGGAAVAGIVIAAIIVAAVIGISSALGTKELIKRAKKNADVGTNNNPLYEADDNEAVNPAFTGDN